MSQFQSYLFSTYPIRAKEKVHNNISITDVVREGDYEMVMEMKRSSS